MRESCPGWTPSSRFSSAALCLFSVPTIALIKYKKLPVCRSGHPDPSTTVISVSVHQSAESSKAKSTCYLRQLSVSPSEATQALLEERVDLCLLYGGGQVHGVQRAGVLVTARPGEGERNHRRLLPLGQEVQEREPDRSVLEGWGHESWGYFKRDFNELTRGETRGITWLAEVFWEVFFVPNDWACLLVRSFLASTAA